MSSERKSPIYITSPLQHQLELQLGLVFLGDKVKTTADFLFVKEVSLGKPHPKMKALVGIAQQQTGSPALVVMGVHRETVIQVVFVGIEPFLVSIGIKESDAEVKAETALLEVHTHILV